MLDRRRFRCVRHTASAPHGRCTRKNLRLAEAAMTEMVDSLV
jgi:hypothetical protein